jgi:hypothetical protein
LEIDFLLTYRQGLQLNLMGNRRWLSVPFLPFPWFEQIGELFDGENPLSLILTHHPRCHAIEQTEIVFLFSLGLTQPLKGAERTMLIQDNGRGLGRVRRNPFVEGLKKRSESFGTRSQFDRMRLPVHPDNSSRSRRRVLESLQNIPDKGQLQLLLFADAVCTHKYRGFIAVFPERRYPFDPGQDTTICGKPIHLEVRIDQHLDPLVEVLH